MASIRISKSKISISFAYDKDMVDDVKAIVPGARWNAGEREWVAPVSAIEGVLQFANRYKDMDWGIDKSAVESARAEVKAALEASKAAAADIEIPGLGGVLRPFQKAGVSYIRSHPASFLADEMGLGKTVQALAAVHDKSAYPALVVCPASLKLNWKREAEKWLPGKTVTVLDGKKAGESLTGNDVVVINYDIVKNRLTELKAIQWKSMILDESHYIKGEKTLRTKAVLELAKTCYSSLKLKLALTGTPILNEPKELVPQLDFLDKLNSLGGKWRYLTRYCGMEKGRFGMEYTPTNTEELHHQLKASCFVSGSLDD